MSQTGIPTLANLVTEHARRLPPEEIFELEACLDALAEQPGWDMFLSLVEHGVTYMRRGLERGGLLASTDAYARVLGCVAGMDQVGEVIEAVRSVAARTRDKLERDAEAASQEVKDGRRDRTLAG